MSDPRFHAVLSPAQHAQQRVQQQAQRLQAQHAQQQAQHMFSQTQVQKAQQAQWAQLTPI
jgi:hypothetical protein